MSDDRTRHQAECKRVYPTFSAKDPCTCGAVPKRPFKDFTDADLVLLANTTAWAAGPVREMVEATLMAFVLLELRERQLEPLRYLTDLLGRATEATIDTFSPIPKESA